MSTITHTHTARWLSTFFCGDYLTEVTRTRRALVTVSRLRQWGTLQNQLSWSFTSAHSESEWNVYSVELDERTPSGKSHQQAKQCARPLDSIGYEKMRCERGVEDANRLDIRWVNHLKMTGLLLESLFERAYDNCALPLSLLTLESIGRHAHTVLSHSLGVLHSRHSSFICSKNVPSQQDVWPYRAISFSHTFSQSKYIISVTAND